MNKLLLDFLFIFLGIFALWIGSEIVIKASQIFSERLKISQTFIGLTILSIGTSIAELATHIAVSINILKGKDISGIALGTNIGSNIVQITAVLAIVALFGKVYAKKEFLNKDYLVMLGSILILFLFSLNGFISRFEGFILALVYLIYLYYLGKVEAFLPKLRKEKTKYLLFYLLIFPIGIAVIIFAADAVVKHAENLASLLKVSNSLIGASIIGIGTALPELTTALVAVRKKATGISVGVLIGSNITNPLFVIGIGALISGYTASSKIIYFDLPVWFFISLIVLFLFYRKARITKPEAAFLFFLYIIYLASRILFIG